MYKKFAVILSHFSTDFLNDMQNNMNCKTNHYALLYVLCAILSAYWFSFAWNQSINTDIVYLTQSAVYFLSGHKMSESFYDNNPPLCILVYIIPAFFIKFLHIPFYQAGLIYGIILVIHSCSLINITLKYFSNVCSAQRHLITLAFFISQTIGAQLYFEEKDQFIILGLFPFILQQIAITQNYKIPKTLKNLSLLTGTIFILIKPHFLIIPALIVIHRVYATKNFQSILRADVYFLLCGLILYALLLITVFADYVFIILPDAITLYTSLHNNVVPPLSLCIAFIIGIILFCAAYLPKNPDKIAVLFLFLSIVCIIPFMVQGKGFYYHLLPTLGFFIAGLCLVIFQYAAQFIKNDTKHAEFLKITICAFICTSIFSFFFTLFYLEKSVLTHQEYKNSPLAKIIANCPNENCTYFMFNDTTEITQQLSVYTGNPHASRFASFWFLPKILSSSPLTPDKKKNLAEKYAAFVAADFKKFKPDTLIIGQFHINPSEEKPFDFIAFFSNHSVEFQSEIQNYKKEETITVPMKTYFPNTLVTNNPILFDIYRKKSETPTQ